MKKVIGGLFIGLGLGVLGACAGIGAILLAVAALLLKSLVAIVIGWAVGYGLQVVSGVYIASALSTILHTIVTASELPQLFAGITLLLHYIRPIFRENNSSFKLESADLKSKYNALKEDLRNTK
jgi:hypothetical protein